MVLFVKAPVPGRCKTRLVPPLQPREAAALYRAFCRDTVNAIQSLSADLWLAYHPDRRFPTPAWLAPGVPFFRQRGATLGRRLLHAFDRLFARGYRRVVALGTDAPTLPLARVRRALAVLSRREAVFGPAHDGGYYLVGLRRRAPALFSGIPWSTPEVMAVTRAVLRREKIRAAFLPSHYDVDSTAELRRLAADVKRPRTGKRCPETRDWLARRYPRTL